MRGRPKRRPASTVRSWNVKTGIMQGGKTTPLPLPAQGQVRQRGEELGKDFTREGAGICKRESCWEQCGKGRPRVLLVCVTLWIGL